MAAGRSKTNPARPSRRAKERSTRPRDAGPRDLSDAINGLQTAFAEAVSPATPSARLAEIWLRLHRTLRGIVLPQLERSGALEFESAVLGLDEWAAAALVDLIDCPPSDPSYANRMGVARTLIELQLAAELSALDAAVRGADFDGARVAVLSDALGDVVIFDDGEEPDFDALIAALTRRSGRAATSRRFGGTDVAARNYRADYDRDDFSDRDEDVSADRVRIPRRGSDYRYEDEADFDRPLGRRHSDEERRNTSRLRDYDDRRD